MRATEQELREKNCSELYEMELPSKKEEQPVAPPLVFPNYEETHEQPKANDRSPHGGKATISSETTYQTSEDIDFVQMSAKSGVHLPESSQLRS
jgi:hypothetical protein